MHTAGVPMARGGCGSITDNGAGLGIVATSSWSHNNSETVIRGAPLVLRRSAESVGISVSLTCGTDISGTRNRCATAAGVSGDVCSTPVQSDQGWRCRRELSAPTTLRGARPHVRTGKRAVPRRLRASRGDALFCTTEGRRAKHVRKRARFVRFVRGKRCSLRTPCVSLVTCEAAALCARALVSFVLFAGSAAPCVLPACHW